MESHANDLRSAVGGEAQAIAVQANFRTAGLSPHEVALLDFAEKLTTSPQRIRRDDLAQLRADGYTDEQLVDAVQCIGYFNFINRVLDGLGVDPEPGMQYAATSPDPGLAQAAT